METNGRSGDYRGFSNARVEWFSDTLIRSSSSFQLNQFPSPIIEGMRCRFILSLVALTNWNPIPVDYSKDLSWWVLLRVVICVWGFSANWNRYHRSLHLICVDGFSGLIWFSLHLFWGFFGFIWSGFLSIWNGSLFADLVYSLYAHHSMLFPVAPLFVCSLSPFAHYLIDCSLFCCSISAAPSMPFGDWIHTVILLFHALLLLTGSLLIAHSFNP